jgi:hypothetical protein
VSWFSCKQESINRREAIRDSYWYQKAEPTAEDSLGAHSGKGEYIPYRRLTNAERERIESGQKRIDAGFDY